MPASPYARRAPQGIGTTWGRGRRPFGSQLFGNIGQGGGDRRQGPGLGRTPPGRVGIGGRILRQPPEYYFPEYPGSPGYRSNPVGGENPLLGFPQTPPAPPSFLPDSPEFEAARRALADRFSAGQASIQAQQGLVQPGINLQQQRLLTDQGYAQDLLNQDLSGRGIWNSGVNPQLYQRDIAIPYGRQYQDLALGGAGQYGDLAQQLGLNQLGYGQGLQEALLNLANQQAAQLPMNLPQFSPGETGFPTYGGGGRHTPPRRARPRRARPRNRVRPRGRR